MSEEYDRMATKTSMPEFDPTTRLTLPMPPQWEHAIDQNDLREIVWLIVAMCANGCDVGAIRMRLLVDGV